MYNLIIPVWVGQDKHFGLYSEINFSIYNDCSNFKFAIVHVTNCVPLVDNYASFFMNTPFMYTPLFCRPSEQFIYSLSLDLQKIWNPNRRVLNTNFMEIYVFKSSAKGERGKSNIRLYGKSHTYFFSAIIFFIWKPNYLQFPDNSYSNWPK